MDHRSTPAPSTGGADVAAARASCATASTANSGRLKPYEMLEKKSVVALRGLLEPLKMTTRNRSTFLTQEELTTLYRRLHKEQVGRDALESWASRGGVDVSNRAWAFFYSPSDDATATAYRNSTSLPQQHLRGLSSAVAAGFEVQLLCYLQVDNLPEGIQLIGAGSVLPEPAFERVAKQKKGKNWSQRAELMVLMLAIHKFGGWAIDCTCQWLSPVDTPLRANPYFGFCFASSEGSEPQGMDDAARQKHKLMNYVGKQGQCWQLQLPIHCPPNSPFTQDLVAWLQANFVDEKPSGYCVPVACDVMRKIADLVSEYGLSKAVAPPVRFAPIGPDNRRRDVVVSARRDV